MKEKGSLEGRIKNEKFVANAPKEVVDETKAKIAELQVQVDAIEGLISSLKD